MSLAGLVLAVATAAGAAPPSAVPHEAEIKLFASAVAVTLVVSSRCPDLGFDDGRLAGLRRMLAIVESDKPALTVEVQYVVGVFKEAMGDEAHWPAWCASAYRLYGPEGSLVRNLIGRPSTK